LVQNAALVAFESEEIIAAQLLRDEARALLLAMQRIGGDQHAGRRVDFFEQRLESRDFVALLLDGHLVERQAQVVRDRREQLQGLAVLPAAAAQHLAIHGQLEHRADFLFGQPRADERGKGARVHSLEHALKGGVTGRIIPAIVLIGPAAQGAQLALREFFTGVLEGAIAARAHEG
jgi:hypothetical protein